MVKSDFHDSLDAKSVDVPHAEVLDAQRLQEVAAGQVTQMILKADMLEPSSSAASLKSFGQISRYSLLSGVHISQSDIDQVPWRQERFSPRKARYIWHLGGQKEGTLKYSLEVHKLTWVQSGGPLQIDSGKVLCWVLRPPSPCLAALWA